MTYVRDSISPSKSAQSSAEETLRRHCKDILKTQLFTGNYIERRFIDNLQDYRDIVKIHKSERVFKQILDDIAYRLTVFYEGQQISIGFQDYTIRTELQGLAFGKYLFQIRTIKFSNKEIMLKLKMLKSCDEIKDTIKTELFENNDDNDAINPDNMTLNVQYFYDLSNSWRNSIQNTIIQFLSHDLNKKNLKDAVKFLLLLIISFFAAAIEAISFLSKFIIRLTIELRKLLKVSMPLLLNVLNALTKIIGGLFILVSMVWRDFLGLTFGYRSPPQNVQRIQYRYQYLPPIQGIPNTNHY